MYYFLKKKQTISDVLLAFENTPGCSPEVQASISIHPVITCLKLTIETVEQGVKYVQS